MKKECSLLAILIPGATVFISSFCIMVLELVASRLIARHLGSSLYTWSAVIGIVLSGITTGNYIGGRVADRFNSRKALSVIFLLCSASCVITVILNNIVGNWLFLWRLSWPLHIFSHVLIVFFFPSLLLGTISPVSAKMALDLNLPTGRTVGDIYACGAAGSIAGTFAAGYFLIDAMGTVAIIWTIGAVLLAMSLLYWLRFFPVYLWAIVFSVSLLMGTAPYQWAKEKGSLLGLRTETDPRVIYEDDTQYCYVSVRKISMDPEIRMFSEDKLEHSIINMENLSDLKYFYTKIYSLFTHELSREKKNISVMAIGGGGYVYPRYVEQKWPGSRIDVVEIDSGVTKAAVEAFGLSRNANINNFNMDARNYVDDLLEKKGRSPNMPGYDFIYGDAFNDFTVPFQLVTKEFNDKIERLLAKDGLYMLNVIDIFDSGLFLSSVVNTLNASFPYVYVIAEDMPHNIRDTFVLVASKLPIDTEKIILDYPEGKIKPRILTDSQIEDLKRKTNKLILTDDYAPVENLLAPVVRESAKETLAEKYMTLAERAKDRKKYEKSIKYYYNAINEDEYLSETALNEIAAMQVSLGNLTGAVETFKSAIEYNEKSPLKNNIAKIYHNLGTVYQRLGQSDKANENFLIAIKQFKEDLEDNPEAHLKWSRLGHSYSSIGELEEATEAFRKAFLLERTNGRYFEDLLKILKFRKKTDEVIELLKEQIDFMKRFNAPQNIIKPLQDRLDNIEFEMTESSGQQQN